LVIRKYIFLILTITLTVLSGCQTVMQRPNVDAELQGCIDFFNNLDSVVGKAGVTDTSTFPVKGFFLSENKSICC